MFSRWSQDQVLQLQPVTPRSGGSGAQHKRNCIDVPVGVPLADNHTYPPSHRTYRAEEVDHKRLGGQAELEQRRCPVASDNPALEALDAAPTMRSREGASGAGAASDPVGAAGA